MASRADSAIISSTRSGSVTNADRNSHLLNTMNATRSTTTNGARLTTKSLNDSPARLAMMMFGGSPIRVAVPPMLDAITSAIRNGATGRFSRSQTKKVTGATSKMVVTLSSRADATAVSTTRSVIKTNGSAAGTLCRGDREQLEQARLLDDPDDHHHPQQQEDDVPVDAGVVRVERSPAVGEPECEHHRRPTQRRRDPMHPLGRDQHVGTREHDHGKDLGQRHPSIQSGAACPGAFSPAARLHPRPPCTVHGPPTARPRVASLPSRNPGYQTPSLRTWTSLRSSTGR